MKHLGGAVLWESWKTKDAERKEWDHVLKLVAFSSVKSNTGNKWELLGIFLQGMVFGYWLMSYTNTSDFHLQRKRFLLVKVKSERFEGFFYYYLKDRPRLGACFDVAPPSVWCQSLIQLDWLWKENSFL